MTQKPARVVRITHQKWRLDHRQPTNRTISASGVALLVAPLIGGALLVAIVIGAGRIIGAI